VKEKDLAELLGTKPQNFSRKMAEYGCYLKRRGKGDHDIWFSPITNLPITVDGEMSLRGAETDFSRGY
jgi:ubiquinone biosynthesis protein Coq4